VSMEAVGAANSIPVRHSRVFRLNVRIREPTAPR
jgi:hypothetical protein